MAAPRERKMSLWTYSILTACFLMIDFMHSVLGIGDVKRCLCDRIDGDIVITHTSFWLKRQFRSLRASKTRYSHKYSSTWACIHQQINIQNGVAGHHIGWMHYSGGCVCSSPLSLVPFHKHRRKGHKQERAQCLRRILTSGLISRGSSLSN